jgi:hypothetical protein
MLGLFHGLTAAKAARNSAENGGWLDESMFQSRDDSVACNHTLLEPVEAWLARTLPTSCFVAA